MITMTPKEKARHLIDKFYDTTPNAEWFNPPTALEEQDYNAYNHALELALICTNEIIEQWEYIDTHIADLGGKLNPNLKYWYEVKNEIYTTTERYLDK